MKRSNFDSVEAYKIYVKYIEQVNNEISMLPQNDIIDIMNEIDSHIYESFICNKSIAGEEERITTVIHNLGEPKFYLKPVIAERQLRQAINKYNIVGILKGVLATLLTGGQYVTVSIVYLFMLLGGFLVIAKIFYPAKTGLFVEDGNFIGFGYLYKINAKTVELLGYWLIPALIISCVIFYFFMTFILKRIVRIRTKLKLKSR
ncbi:MAG: hypothetical protein LBG80_09505 [Bacteroidales bacterium]|jgi:uncharacterized membrane protein|nr:hypothetical protein [Bacteroidales bacterium]